MKDFFSDSSLKLLHKLASYDSGLRRFLKLSKETLITESESLDLPSSAFADEGNRVFPIHTPEMAKLSYYYAHDQKADTEILSKIAQSLELFGEPVPDITVGSMPKESSFFLLSDLELYPANNANEVKMAAAYFEDYGYQLSSDHRKEYCRNLVKAASEFRVASDDLSSHIKRYAGITGTDLRKLAMEIESRIYICQENNKPKIFEEGYLKIAEVLSQFEGPLVYDQPRVFEKISSAIADIDREAGISDSYAHVINDPYIAVFNTEKLAEATLNIDGVTIPCSKLSKLSKSDYNDALGPEFTNEVFDGNNLNIEALKVIVSTLPLDMKRELLRYLKNV